MATDDRLLYEGELDESSREVYLALYVDGGHYADVYVGDKDQDDIDFWRSIANLWVAAPLMQLRLKEARDAIATLPIDALGTCSAPDFIGNRTGEGVDYDTTQWGVRDELLGHIDDALKEAKGE